MPGTPPSRTRRLDPSPITVTGTSAGAINSTELLLKSRPNLERIGDALGHHYSANGDFLAFVLDTSTPMDAHLGPVITTAVLHDRGKGGIELLLLSAHGAESRDDGQDHGNARKHDCLPQSHTS